METVILGYDRHAAAPRVRYGLRLLAEALGEAGYTVQEADTGWQWDSYRQTPGKKIYIGSRKQSGLLQRLEESEVLLYHAAAPAEEGFYLGVCPGELWVVSGGNDSGVLYGCQELARRIGGKGSLPRDIAYGDAPHLTLRGPALGLQKTTVEPPRQTYEYPITPDRFPWFYDRGLWLEYLDSLLEDRCNVVYLWSGHPFSSLLRLEDYPEALEVTEEEFRLNQETLRWLAEEADRRGIWIVLKFYNIHIPLPFAEKHGLSLRQTKPTALTSDYYRKSLAAFVRTFPNVGLMICLGEALQGHMYGEEWFRDTLLEGINEGLEGKSEEEKPPVILRGHAIEPEKVIGKVLSRYPNLYTMSKYNGESLTTWTPRGKWQKTHRFMASLGSVHIVNVHVLANLEPFRYGAPSFIRKSVQAIKHRLGAGGLHLYPLFFWDWPFSPDKAEPRLRQMDRDWIWFKAWFRYAWNPDRDPEAEELYWTRLLAERYGDPLAGTCILEAYEAAGEVAPKLLRRFGITEGNRQTMSLGMTMSQLTNPDRHTPWPDLWESHAPQGERLETYVVRELAGEPHIGETPLDAIHDAEHHADEALAAIARAERLVKAGQEEFSRWATDVRAIHSMTLVYKWKVMAAIRVLTYKHAVKGQYFNRLNLLEEAAAYMEKSLEAYRDLAELTADTYLFANSMQTPQRKVPIKDGMKFRHWTQCLPVYEQELEAFKRNLQQLQSNRLPAALQRAETPLAPYEQVPFALHTDGAETYTVQKGGIAFTDGDIQITGCADELSGLTGIRFSQTESRLAGTAIEIELKQPARVLVGYFNSKEEQWLQAPNLEDNTHADDQGGYEPILRKGIKLYVYPSVNVHAYRYEAGRHTLDYGKGAYMIVGVIEAESPIVPREVLHRQDGADTLDWLYE